MHFDRHVCGLSILHRCSTEVQIALLSRRTSRRNAREVCQTPMTFLLDKESKHKAASGKVKTAARRRNASAQKSGGQAGQALEEHAAQLMIKWV